MDSTSIELSMKSIASTKHVDVRRRLEAAIRDREFSPGSQIPGEHALAERFGVSYMTARKAVHGLVQAEMLERRARIGTFVRSIANEQVGKRRVNLVTYAFDGAWQQKFLSHGVHLAEQAGWHANIIRLASGHQAPAVHAIQNGEAAIVFVDELDPQSALGRAMRSARVRTVLLNSLLSHEGIASVSYDLEVCADLAWRCFSNAGHRKIGLVFQAPADANALLVIGHWRERMKATFTEAEIDSNLVPVNVPKLLSPSVPAAETLGRYFALGGSDVTALICLGDQLTLGVLSACHKARRDVSLVNMGDSPLLAVSIPPVTCVDVDVEEQVNLAFAILRTPKYKLTRADLRKVVTPHLVERDSVRPISLMR